MDPTQVRRGPDGVMRCTQCGFGYNLPPDRVAEQTRAGLDAVQAAIASVPPQVRDRRPSPEVWSVNAYTAHLADVGELVDDRARRILTEDRPDLPNHDQDAIAREGHYDQRPVEESMPRLIDAAQAFQLRMQGLPQGAWDRVGRHQRAGDVRLRDIAHDLPHELHHHAGDIRRVGDAVSRGDSKVGDGTT